MEGSAVCSSLDFSFVLYNSVRHLFVKAPSNLSSAKSVSGFSGCFRSISLIEESASIIFVHSLGRPPKAAKTDIP